MRNYASFRGNWPVVPDGFESLRSLQLRLSLKKHAGVAPIIGSQRNRRFVYKLPKADGALLPSVDSSVSER
jgi:hypothetical protein